MTVAETTMPLPADLINAALDTIFAGEAFRRSKRSQQLLRYLVSASLEQPGEPVAAEAIATEVFKRRPGFDGIEDPIVRTSICRLRTLLSAHYAQEKSTAPVEIRIRRGAYILEFLPRTVSSKVAGRGVDLRRKLLIASVIIATISLMLIVAIRFFAGGACSP